MQDVGGLIICNGYKDSSYIETALLAQKFDKTVIVVLERLEELDIVLKASEKLGIRPHARRARQADDQGRRALGGFGG